MKQNRLLALAMAGAMMTGTLAPTVPVFAAGNNTTTVSLTVQRNTYTMTVPAATTLNSDGTAEALTGGIQITKGTLEKGKKLTVEAKSQNSWKMKASNVDTGIGYTLYSDAGTTAATSWEFSQDEANAENGTTKAVYAKANADDVKSAAAGSYSDVITFTASVADAKEMVEFTIDGEKHEVEKGADWWFLNSSSDVIAIYESTYVIKNGDSTYFLYDSNNEKVNANEEIQSGAYTFKASVIKFTLNNESYEVTPDTKWSTFLTSKGLDDVQYVYDSDYDFVYDPYDTDAVITAGDYLVG